MRTRKEVADFINRGAEGKQPTLFHFGNVELRMILDYIYDGTPADDTEHIWISERNRKN